MSFQKIIQVTIPQNDQVKKVGLISPLLPLKKTGHRKRPQYRWKLVCHLVRRCSSESGKRDLHATGTFPETNRKLVVVFFPSPIWKILLSILIKLDDETIKPKKSLKSPPFCNASRCYIPWSKWRILPSRCQKNWSYHEDCTRCWDCQG